GKTILDFGCGTGILSILASKIGAEKIKAIDNDEWAVENAKENFSLNQVTNATIISGSELPALETFNVLLSNINLPVIVTQFQAFQKCICENGILLISGFMVTDQKTIMDCASANSFTLSQKLSEDEWLAMAFVK